MLRLFTVFLLLSWSATASADNENKFDYGWFASAMVSYIDDDEDRNVEDGLRGFHLGIGTGFNKSIAFEFSVVWASHKVNDFTVQRQLGFGLDYLHRLGHDAYLSPYAIVGGGYLKTTLDNPAGPHRQDAMTSVGLGIFVPLSSRGLFLRTELRARKDFSSNGQVDYLLSFGLHGAIGRSLFTPSDSDHDSISNTEDLCPGTPVNTPVDRFGCAIK